MYGDADNTAALDDAGQPLDVARARRLGYLVGFVLYRGGGVQVGVTGRGADGDASGLAGVSTMPARRPGRKSGARR